MRNAFIFPEEATPRQIQRAKTICATCPRLKKCASEALDAGSDLSHEKRAPASGVIMAGVLCDGSKGALDALEKAAGVRKVYKSSRKRIAFGTPCRNCETPMVRWSRLNPPIPDGYAMHYGRGLCSNCRGVYRKELAAWKAANPKRAARKRYGGKPTDRNNATLETLRGKIETAVKNGDEELADELRYRWSVERDRRTVRIAVAKGETIVELPARGAKTDRALLEWQRNPNRSDRDVAAVCDCSASVASMARLLLITAGVPGFASSEEFRSEWERAWRIKSAKGALNRMAVKQRRQRAMALLRDRPDLSQNQVAKIVGIDRHTVRALAREYGATIRPSGRS